MNHRDISAELCLQVNSSTVAAQRFLSEAQSSYRAAGTGTWTRHGRPDSYGTELFRACAVSRGITNSFSPLRSRGLYPDELEVLFRPRIFVGASNFPRQIHFQNLKQKYNSRCRRRFSGSREVHPPHLVPCILAISPLEVIQT